MVCAWKREFYDVSDRTFLFMVFLPFSKFFFMQHVDPIIKKVESDVEVATASNSMVFQVYDHPPHTLMFICLKLNLPEPKKLLLKH